jgi:hypothetical protein
MPRIARRGEEEGGAFFLRERRRTRRYERDRATRSVAVNGCSAKPTLHGMPTRKHRDRGVSHD